MYKPTKLIKYIQKYIPKFTISRNPDNLFKELYEDSTTTELKIPFLNKKLEDKVN